MIDYKVYPHIVDAVIALASHSTLLVVRTTSRALRKKVDRLLYRHVVVTGLRDGTTKGLLSPSGNRLPFLRELLQPGSGRDESRLNQARRLLAHTEVIDFIWITGADPAMGIDNLRSVALICAMDHARLGQLPCTFRFLVEWGANRALSLVSWPNQTHTTVVSFLNQLSPRGGQRFTFWHFSQTAAQSHSLRMSAVPRLATFGGAFFPWVGGWHEWRVHDIPDYTQIVVHIWGPETPGYWPKVVVPDSDIGILEDIITGMLQLPRLSWCLVGVETIPPTQFGGLEKLSDDWALRREVLLHRFRTKTTANVKLLTRAEYCREFGGKRFILESGRPDTTDDPADIGSGFDLASRRWRP